MTVKATVLIFCFVIMLSAGDARAAKKHECAYCHSSHRMISAPLKSPLADLCLGCHPDSMGENSHKVNVISSIKPVDLPLTADGKMTCITCHDPHGREKHASFLRKNYSELCQTCHKKY
jgi:predicted CXXCH cytochrome family protein